MFKKMTILGTLFAALATFAASSEADVEEVNVSNSNDITIKVVWTGSGSKSAGSTDWLHVHKTTFGENGVSRISAIALTAMTSGKTCWIDFDDNTKDMSAIKLKATRN